MNTLLPGVPSLFTVEPVPSHSVVLVGVVGLVSVVLDHELDWLEVEVDPVPKDALPPLKNISTA